ncbi:MAG: hypothetical protein MJZ34_11335 [Paludibacteraceae bacterium]|nr:hypothetical protein [Paludibacteraceae bacterium]
MELDSTKFKALFGKIKLPCASVDCISDNGSSVLMFYECEEAFHQELIDIQNQLRIGGFPYNFLVTITDFNNEKNDSVGISCKDFNNEIVNIVVGSILDLATKEE